MSGHEIFDAVIRVVQVVILPVIGMAAKWLHSALSGVQGEIAGVRSEMSRLNGRMLTQEQWARSHDKQDDERHTTLNEQLHDIRDAMRERA